MTAQSGGLGQAGSVPWALGHPGVAALVSAIATIVGLVGVVVGLAQRSELAHSGLLGGFWVTALLVVSAVTFVVALPASLGFAGASCATQRELWGGVLGGFITVLTTLVVVGIVLPVHTVL